MVTPKQKFAALSVWLLAAVLLLAAGSLDAVAQEVTPAQEATVQVAEHDEVGAHLVDAEGMSLYLFENDSEANSTCYDECVTAWPPYTVEGGPEPGEGINIDMLNVIDREDGMTQVTYNGWPLYYYVEDTQPGDIRGHDVEGFGAEWYLISPEGEKVEGQGAAE